ncbi:hypothetical protein E2C01_101566 [Portunus trituberculatus]|uniref:Uncharacterized protein n=1 Tax=Portunus trituberculatus TaxID=210409 RepID=A0A5B7KKB6_PORTR|nr:hypothetical protein [Portunus trituberculatus]
MAVLALYHQHAPTRAPTSAIKVKSTPLSLTTHQFCRGVD